MRVYIIIIIKTLKKLPIGEIESNIYMNELIMNPNLMSSR